jgi:hypothetical protein
VLRRTPHATCYPLPGLGVAGDASCGHCNACQSLRSNRWQRDFHQSVLLARCPHDPLSSPPPTAGQRACHAAGTGVGRYAVARRRGDHHHARDITASSWPGAGYPGKSIDWQAWEADKISTASLAVTLPNPRQQKARTGRAFHLYGALDRIRTCDRSVRSRVLYPAELRVQVAFVRPDYHWLKQRRKTSLKTTSCMVHSTGFEPVTARFVAEYSIQLSYECICCRAL